MKKVLIFLLISIFNFGWAQNVIFNKVIKTHTNKDKFFYKIDSERNQAEYLAEIEIQGYSENDVEMFSKIYAKAKEVGANSFAYEPFYDIDGTKRDFDSWNYKMKLYYVNENMLESEENIIYVFSPSTKQTKVGFNNETIVMDPRSYFKKPLTIGETYEIYSKKLLGSSVKFSINDNQDVQHLMINPLDVKENKNNQGGIIINNGDIVVLEKSFAQFLSVIYKEIEYKK